MRISWGPAKNRRNLAKHGVSFELAGGVFEDPLQLTRRDPHEHEERWQTLGLVNGLIVIIVAHTVREGKDGEEEIRIISARKATPAEREAYEGGS